MCSPLKKRKRKRKSKPELVVTFAKPGGIGPWVLGLNLVLQVPFFRHSIAQACRRRPLQALQSTIRSHEQKIITGHKRITTELNRRIFENRREERLRSEETARERETHTQRRTKCFSISTWSATCSYTRDILDRTCATSSSPSSSRTLREPAGILVCVSLLLEIWESGLFRVLRFSELPLWMYLHLAPADGHQVGVCTEIRRFLLKLFAAVYD